MTDLIKDWRELHAKIVNGETSTGECEVFVWDHLPKLLDELEAWKKEADDSQHKELDASYDNAKLRIELNRHKEALKQAALNVEASQKAARAYCDELARYKKALEVCRKQRILFAAIGYDPTQPEFLNHLIEERDIEIDQILEGEVSNDL